MSDIRCVNCRSWIQPRLIRHTPVWVWFLVLGLALSSLLSCVLSYFVAVLLWVAVGVAVSGWGCLWIFEVIQVCPRCRTDLGRYHGG